MPLKLNSTGGGSVTLDAPNTASNYTVTFPAQTATLITLASGTAMIFNQTSAPTGWTKVTTHNDKALRIVSGAVGTGGSVAFSTAFASQSVSGTVGSTTLSTSQMPSHSHIATAWEGSFGPTGSGRLYYSRNGDLTYQPIGTDSVGGGGSHNHSFTGTAINLAVSYVDVIIATVD